MSLILNSTKRPTVGNETRSCVWRFNKLYCTERREGKGHDVSLLKAILTQLSLNHMLHVFLIAQIFKRKTDTLSVAIQSRTVIGLAGP